MIISFAVNPFAIITFLFVNILITHYLAPENGKRNPVTDSGNQFRISVYSALLEHCYSEAFPKMWLFEDVSGHMNSVIITYEGKSLVRYNGKGVR